MSITWDDRDGIGAVPNAVTGDYFGFLRVMTAAGFLALVPEREHDTLRLVEPLRNGAALGRPFLEVREEDGAWRVRSHEGRGRCHAIAEVHGPDTPVEVWVWPQGGLRRRHLSDDQCSWWRLLPDTRRR